ncbi:hypothetical protein BELL_0427g00100 [Botrytis elliptica]|uniref:Uncharacterized protein n=1 Tax=Botrytis elliptica TaxID=278938 RepID=A0A4Z1JGH9_9HELO|nr:hypothetical protein BELL_0427g00100 [Botrytis elliptica]
MCRSIYSLAFCGHEFISGKQKCESYLAWEAAWDQKSAPPPVCSTPEADPHDVKTFDYNCYECKPKFNTFRLDMVERRDDASLIRRDMDKAIVAAGGAYTGKQRYEMLKRFEDYNHAIEMMFEDVEHEFHGTHNVLDRVRGEAESAKKEVAEWKERVARLWDKAALIPLLIISVRFEHEAVDQFVAAIKGAMLRQLCFKSGT